MSPRAGLAATVLALLAGCQPAGDSAAPAGPPPLPTQGEVWGDRLAGLPDWTGLWVPGDCARAPAEVPLLGADEGVLEFLIAPEQTLIVRADVDLVRRVYTDGRPHPPAAAWPPSPLGHSVGRWEGDTLVIETTHLLVRLPDGRPAPADPARRTVERIRRTAPDTLEIALALHDPAQHAEPVRRTRLLRPTDRTTAPDCSGRSGAIARPGG